MSERALKMIADYLETQGKLVYARYIEHIISELAALRAQVEELSKEVASPVLVATNRLADSLADVRAENERLRSQVEEKDKALAKAEQCFFEYTEIHASKGNTDMAIHNWELSVAMRSAIASTGRK